MSPIIDEKTKFGYVVLVLLVTIAFGIGGLFWKVDSLDSRLSRIEGNLIEKGMEKLSVLKK